MAAPNNSGKGTQTTGTKPCPSPNCRGGMRTSGEVCATCYGRGVVPQ